MDTYLLLLRGINVGGRNRLPMADLRVLLSGLGFADVATYLQSGNVVCTGSGRAGDVAERVATAIADEMSLTVPVVARTSAEWATVIAGNPFAGVDDDPKRLHVTFLAGEPDPNRVNELMAESGSFEPDKVAVVGPDVYLHVPRGYSDTGLQNAFLERKLGQVASTRNWRTVTALAELAGLPRTDRSS